MITKNIGMLLLALYLILVGIIGIFGMSLGAASILVPILALVAGILILLGKERQARVAGCVTNEFRPATLL